MSAAKHLFTAAHHLFCVAGASNLAAAVLRKDFSGGCQCPVLVRHETIPPQVKQRALLCKKASEACIEAVQAKDVRRVRKLKAEYVAHASAVRDEVSKLFSSRSV